MAGGHGALAEHAHNDAAVGHAGGLGHIHADHILEQLHQALGAAGVELVGGLCPFRQIVGTRRDPLFTVLVVHQLLDRLVLKLAKTGLPQVVDRKGVLCIREQDVCRLHCTQQGRGEHGIHLRILEPLLQLSQLSAALITQRDVRAAADVQALQVAGSHAVADEVKLESFHG